VLTSPGLGPHHPTGDDGGLRRRYLMCPPAHFDVVYRINPWMHPRRRVDRDRAARQWRDLRSALTAMDHDVEVMEPVAGLPDMVFAANAAIVVGSRALTANMATKQRRPEELPYQRWLAEHGITEVRPARHPNEGEGDFVLVGDRMLAGTGFRTTPSAHEEAADFFGLDVVTLHLRDPRWYHLDTALFAVDDETIAYHPGAFDKGSRHVLEQLYPDAVIVGKHDALAFGCNSISDGRHVVVAHAAKRLAAQLRERGFEAIPVDTSEFHRAGGSAKCCVLELHHPVTRTMPAVP
jgi:N-dimethylarginine dimethylaminohydrolase